MAKTKDSSNDSSPGFETRVKSLDQLVHKLEDQDLGLEDALSEFERGIRLARSIQKDLELAEQRVTTLLVENGSPSSEERHLGEN